MPETTPAPAPTHIVLLHGLWASPIDMALLARFLRRSGYVVHNTGYLSMRRGIHDNAVVVARSLRMRGLYDVPALGLIGHSMGGLVIRALFDRGDAPANVTRIITIGTPHAGSAWVDAWRARPFTRPVFDMVYGPAGRELSPTHTVIANLRAGPLPPCPIGTIAGTHAGVLPFASRVLGPDHDGLVAVDATRLSGADHINVRASHPFIIDTRAAQTQIGHFLTYGAFDRTR